MITIIMGVYMTNDRDCWSMIVCMSQIDMQNTFWAIGKIMTYIGLEMSAMYICISYNVHVQKQIDMQNTFRVIGKILWGYRDECSAYISYNVQKHCLPGNWFFFQTYRLLSYIYQIAATTGVVGQNAHSYRETKVRRWAIPFLHWLVYTEGMSYQVVVKLGCN